MPGESEMTVYQEKMLAFLEEQFPSVHVYSTPEEGNYVEFWVDFDHYFSDEFSVALDTFLEANPISTTDIISFDIMPNAKDTK